MLNVIQDVPSSKVLLHTMHTTPWMRSLYRVSETRVDALNLITKFLTSLQELGCSKETESFRCCTRGQLSEQRVIQAMRACAEKHISESLGTLSTLASYTHRQPIGPVMVTIGLTGMIITIATVCGVYQQFLQSECFYDLMTLCEDLIHHTDELNRIYKVMKT
ncbi:hypothetical protein AH06_250 [Erwinia phage AH06]|nr:hypothetical protein AH06_250 [Erwinia phage AH06]